MDDTYIVRSITIGTIILFAIFYLGKIYEPIFIILSLYYTMCGAYILGDFILKIISKYIKNK